MANTPYIQLTKLQLGKEKAGEWAKGYAKDQLIWVQLYRDKEVNLPALIKEFPNALIEDLR